MNEIEKMELAAVINKNLNDYIKAADESQEKECLARYTESTNLWKILTGTFWHKMSRDYRAA